MRRRAAPSNDARAVRERENESVVKYLQEAGVVCAGKSRQGKAGQGKGNRGRGVVDSDDLPGFVTGHTEHGANVFFFFFAAHVN